MIRRLLSVCGTLLALAASGASSAATFTYDSTHPPLPIPDGIVVVPANSPLAVTDSFIVSDLNVRINVTHTWDADLDIFLVTSAGTSIELSTDNGGPGDNYINTTFDQQAATAITAGVAPFTGSFRPEGNLSVVNGSNAQGVWTLRIFDDLFAEVGTLNGWRLSFEGEAVAVIPEPQTYALMLAGLALLGFAARRTRPSA